MANFNATDAALRGFRVVREHPKPALVWSAIQIVVSVVIGAAMVAVAGPSLMTMQADVAAHPGDPTVAMGMIQKILPLYGFGLIFALVYYPVLLGAMSRAVLRPADSRFAYLRVSMDEVRLLLLLLLIFGVCIGGYFLVLIPTVIVSLAAGAAGKAAAAVIVPLLLIACWLAWTWVWVRLSLAVPLTFDTQRVDLFGSWQLTQGRFWKLLGTYLMVICLAIVVIGLVFVICAVVAALAGGGFEGLSTTMLHPDMGSLKGYFTPARLAVTVIGAGSAGLLWPLLLTPAVEIYRQITADQPRV